LEQELERAQMQAAAAEKDNNVAFSEHREQLQAKESELELLQLRISELEQQLETRDKMHQHQIEMMQNKLNEYDSIAQASASQLAQLQQESSENNSVHNVDVMCQCEQRDLEHSQDSIDEMTQAQIQMQDTMVQLQNAHDECKGQLQMNEEDKSIAEKKISQLRQQIDAYECELQTVHATTNSQSAALAQQTELLGQADAAAAKFKAGLELHHTQASNIQQQLSDQLIECRKALEEKISVLEARDVAQRAKQISTLKQLEQGERQRAALEKKLSAAVDDISKSSKARQNKSSFRSELKWKEEQMKIVMDKELEAERLHRLEAETLAEELKKQLQVKVSE